MVSLCLGVSKAQNLSVHQYFFLPAAYWLLAGGVPRYAAFSHLLLYMPLVDSEAFKILIINKRNFTLR